MGSLLESVPQSIATSSILQYLNTYEWLSFRLASKSCYKVVHGTQDLCHAHCSKCEAMSGCPSHVSSRKATDESESEALWKLALVRDFRFEVQTDGSENEDVSANNQLYHSFHSPMNSENDSSFLTTHDLFEAPNAFSSWKHWKKIDRCIHRIRSHDSYISPGERVVGPYFLRAALLWKKIEQWCDDEALSEDFGHQLKETFRPGRGLDPNLLTDDGGEYETKISALKAVYSFYSGQTRSNPRSTLLGLFGGCSAYDFMSITRWLENPIFSNETFEALIAVDIIDPSKEVIMDITTGQVYVKYQSVRFLATPITPGVRNFEESEDSILCWFEEFADRLANKIYAVGQFSSPHLPFSPQAILQYPTAVDTVRCSRAVTRGVEIVASSVFVPGFRLSREGGIFVYSIRMRLLTPEDGEEYVQPERRGFDTCQLVSRHWRITLRRGTSSETSIEEVRGEGVVGEYPLLKEGGYENYFSQGGPVVLARSSSLQDYMICEENGTFSYQSCTDLSSISMEGTLQFVAGSINQPTGDTFDVRVAPFQLDRNPGFVY